MSIALILASETASRPSETASCQDQLLPKETATISQGQKKRPTAGLMPNQLATVSQASDYQQWNGYHLDYFPGN